MDMLFVFALGGIPFRDYKWGTIVPVGTNEPEGDTKLESAILFLPHMLRLLA